MREIETDIRARSTTQGIGPVEMRTTYSPAWTTDWIAPEARAKLEAYGIAPPGAAERERARFSCAAARRRCAARTASRCDTEQKSEFGSTACKSIWCLPRVPAAVRGVQGDLTAASS